MMDIIWLLLIGLIIGVVAKLLMPGDDPGGCIVTMLLGVAGAFMAPYLGQLLDVSSPGGLVWFGLAVLGSVLLLAVYRLLLGRRSS
jgi:uncharacterized membrane protein YeaQ/YmgE (transglycosylase-associated protein family)